MEVTAITYCISLWHTQHHWTIVFNGNIQCNTGRVNVENKRIFICNSNHDYETQLNFRWVYTQWLWWKYKICTWACPILWASIFVTLTVQYKSYAKILKKIHCLSKTSCIFSNWCHVKFEIIRVFPSIKYLMAHINVTIQLLQCDQQLHTLC